MTKKTSKELRKEQLALLRFEKQLAALAGVVAAGSATAASAATKVDAAASAEGYDKIRQALVHLAEVTTEVHAAMNAKAIEAGLRIMEAAGGTPKTPPLEIVRSILGNG
jgi:hypothetical protein